MIFIFHRDRIDLVDLNKASPLLMLEIATKGRVLYEEKDGFLRFKLKASARYADTRKLRRLRQDYLNQELS
jgi:urease accessory protein UreH